MKLAAKNIQFRLKTFVFLGDLSVHTALVVSENTWKFRDESGVQEDESSSASEMKNIVKNNSIRFYPHRLQSVPTPPFIRCFSNKNKTLRWEPGAGSGGVVRCRKVKWKKMSRENEFFSLIFQSSWLGGSNGAVDSLNMKHLLIVRNGRPDKNKCLDAIPGNHKWILRN